MPGGIYWVYTTDQRPMTRHRPKTTIRTSSAPARPAASPPIASGPTRARLFTNGRSQAVRLPKAFRFPGSEVLIRRGDGDTVVLEPVPQSTWPDHYWETIDELADDLALGRVPPIGGRLLDVDLEED